jgi:hypothetical protein
LHKDFAETAKPSADITTTFIVLAKQQMQTSSLNFEKKVISHIVSLVIAIRSTFIILQIKRGTNHLFVSRSVEVSDKTHKTRNKDKTTPKRVIFSYSFVLLSIAIFSTNKE